MCPNKCMPQTHRDAAGYSPQTSIDALHQPAANKAAGFPWCWGSQLFCKSDKTRVNTDILLTCLTYCVILYMLYFFIKLFSSYITYYMSALQETLSNIFSFVFVCDCWYQGWYQKSDTLKAVRCYFNFSTTTPCMKHFFFFFVQTRAWSPLTGQTRVRKWIGLYIQLP